MGERQVYYDHRFCAEQQPSRYMSIILDGMSQSHTNLPWLANLKSFSTLLPQHLQGVIEHGQELVIYRFCHSLFSSML